MLLGIEERIGVDDIELYVMATLCKVGTDEGNELAEVLLALHHLGYEAYVEERAARLSLVELAKRTDDGRGAIGVGSVRGRSAIAYGKTSETAISWLRTHYQNSCGRWWKAC